MDDRRTIFSDDRIYRYTLWREWGQLLNNLSYVMFTCLNPSKADERINDNTVTKCINLAKLWGFGAFCMTNEFGYRATDPKDMKRHPEPIGCDNDKWLVECARGADLLVLGWGNHGTHLNRHKAVVDLLAPHADLYCLRVTGKQQPEHPLYLPMTVKPIPFQPAW